MNIQKERNQNVDFLRGLAILMVVLGHTMTGSTKNAQDSLIFNIIWSIQMPLFVLISGYVCRYSRNIETARQLMRFLCRRSVAYLVPWISWTFLVRGFLLKQEAFLNLKYLLWHMDNGYWFLCMIWTISLVHGLSQYLTSRFLGGVCADSEKIRFTLIEGLVYGIFMVLLLAVGLAAGINFLCIKLTLYYMPFYFIGMLYGRFQEEFQRSKHYDRRRDCVVAFCLLAYFYMITRVNMYEVSGIWVLCRMLASVSGCTVLASLLRPVAEQHSKNKGFILLCWCGVHSLEIYLTHYLLLNLLHFLPVPQFETAIGFLSVGTNYAATLLLVVAAVYLLNQNRAVRLILFGKDI